MFGDFRDDDVCMGHATDDEVFDSVGRNSAYVKTRKLKNVTRHAM